MSKILNEEVLRKYIEQSMENGVPKVHLIVELANEIGKQISSVIEQVETSKMPTVTDAVM